MHHEFLPQSKSTTVIQLTKNIPGYMQLARSNLSETPLHHGSVQRKYLNNDNDPISLTVRENNGKMITQPT